MEGKQLSDEEAYDNYLIGGGLFTTAILTGVLTSGKFSGKSKVVTAEMKADPYHPDWKNYTGKERGVGADVVKGGEGAQGEASGLLPKPGSTSLPASGLGANAAFKVDSKQLGKKLGKHVEDFGGNAASPTDRKMVLDKIHDIGSNTEKVIPGTFAGQGANGARGDVLFRVKGDDVVVTKPDGTFVTILKDGMTQNTSVRNALMGGGR
ncbi:hypothetical protein [Pseudomonas syringae]|uniref:hypothetical protein n=1 Tax=Pseudomonas syringae TaxID=317 RepID=UPI003F757148